MKVEIPSSVHRLVKKQEDLLDEAIRRIENGQISRFDRIQYRRALAEDTAKQLEIAEEIAQKLIGPDFHTKAIKTNFGMLRELRELGLQRFALYHQLVQPKLQQMILTLNQRGFQLTDEILNDPDLDKYDN